MVAYVEAGVNLSGQRPLQCLGQSSKFLPSTVKGLKFNGQLWGVPYNTNAQVMLPEEHLEEVRPEGAHHLGRAAQRRPTISAKESRVCPASCAAPTAPPCAVHKSICWFFQINQHMFKQSGGKWVPGCGRPVRPVFQLPRPCSTAAQPLPPPTPPTWA